MRSKSHAKQRACFCSRGAYVVFVGVGMANEAKPSANKKNLDSPAPVLRLSNVNGDNACDVQQRSLKMYDTEGLKRDIDSKRKFCSIDVRVAIQEHLDTLHHEIHMLQALEYYSYNENTHRRYYEMLKKIYNKANNHAFDRELLLNLIIETQDTLESLFTRQQRRNLYEMLEYAFSILASAKDYTDCICAEVEVNAVRQAINLPEVEQ
jgi:hypothetical protein